MGQIRDGVAVLNEIGRLVEKVWLGLTDHYGHASLDQFIVMPNHLHGIIVLENFHRVGLKPTPTRRHGLPEIVRGFKTFSSRRINALKETPGISFWQRNYYERVIRDEKEFTRARDYIVDNPKKWELDKYTPYRKATV